MWRTSSALQGLTDLACSFYTSSTEQLGFGGNIISLNIYIVFKIPLGYTWYVHIDGAVCITSCFELKIFLLDTLECLDFFRYHIAPCRAMLTGKFPSAYKRVLYCIQSVSTTIEELGDKSGYILWKFEAILVPDRKGDILYSSCQKQFCNWKVKEHLRLYT